MLSYICWVSPIQVKRGDNAQSWKLNPLFAYYVSYFTLNCSSSSVLSFRKQSPWRFTLEIQWNSELPQVSCKHLRTSSGIRGNRASMTKLRSLCSSSGASRSACWALANLPRPSNTLKIIPKFPKPFNHFLRYLKIFDALVVSHIWRIHEQLGEQ